MKTTREWLNELPDGYRELALDNVTHEGNHRSLAQAIDDSFRWEKTPEGDRFWFGVYEWVRGLSKLPPLPIKAASETSMVIPMITATGIEATVCADIAKRQVMGMAKYQISVAENSLSQREWLNHAYEECLDMAIYLKRAIMEIDKTEVEP